MLQAKQPMFVAWGDELTFLYNDAYRDILGAKHPGMGLPFARLWADIWPQFGPIVERVLAGEAAWFEDLPVAMTRSGRLESTWFSFSYTPLRDESGAVRGLFCACVETTAAVLDRQRREVAESNVRESETRFRNMAEHAPVMMWVTDADGRCQYLNRAWYAFTGQTQAEAEGFGWLDATHPDDREDAERVFLEANATQAPFRLEYRLRRADGAFRWAIDAASPRFDADGAFLGYIGSVIDIDERREMERALLASEARLRVAAEASGVGVWDWDLLSNALSWDDRTRALFGVGPEEPVSYETVFLPALHPDDVEPTVRAIEAAVAPAGGGAYDIDYRTIGLNDGVERWVRATGRAILEDGRAVRFTGTVIDISDRKRAEAELRASEARFRAIADSIDQMVWSTRPDGYHDFYNQRWYDFTGVPPGSTDGEGWNDMFHPDDQERAFARWRRSLETGAPYEIEYRLRHRSGEYRWVLGRAQAMRDANGAIVRWFGTCTDIHDLKAMESALRESEADYRAAAELNPQVAWTAQPDGQLDRVASRWREWTGVSGLGDSWGRSLHPDDLPHTVEAWTRSITTGVPYDVEHRVMRLDGEVRWARSRAFPRRDEQGAILRWYGSTEDIHERKVAELELQSLNARLEQEVEVRTRELRLAEESLRQAQKMEAIGQLTGGIAHDFNNLLTGIIGSLDLIKRRLQDGRTSGLDRYMDAASASAQRAAALTHRLLAFARRQSLDLKPTNVNGLVLGMEELLARTLGERIELRLELKPELWPAMADANQLESALLNLAINARDAMPEGGRLKVSTEHIHVDALDSTLEAPPPPGDYVSISVADTGSGMAPEVVERAFEPFFTTKPLGSGTGLGLSMVYGFAKQVGGNVRIFSTPGQGTTVRLKLPRATSAAEVASKVADRPLAPGRGETVLVVEDDPAVRMLVLDLMSELGYATLEAHDGPAAVPILQSDAAIDLLVTDVGLPGLDGRKVADRARDARPDLPVLFITGYAQEAGVRSGFLDEGMDLITKPFAAEELAGKVTEMLGKRGPA